MSSIPPHIVFGTADLPAVEAIKHCLIQCGVPQIDTAARYPPTNSGLSETLIGQAGFNSSGFAIDTKVLAGGGGSLAKEKIAESVGESMQRLGVQKVHVLYVHAPDKETPIVEQAEEFERQYELGRFEQLGVCNLEPAMLEEWVSIANQRGWIKPTVYQGQYNLLVRVYEKELFPLLRKHGIKFNAFSPLAGGFLTGKLTPSADPSSLVGTRLEEQAGKANAAGTALRMWYDKPGMHDAISKLREISEKHGMPMQELALRWLRFHSALMEGDGILIGGRNVEQIEGAVEMLGKGLLAKEVVEELEQVEDIVGSDAEGIVTL